MNHTHEMEPTPVPDDDGACDHLTGMVVPRLALPSTGGCSVDLHEASLARRVVVYAYPRTGVPDRDPPKGWNAIPGARGCTLQSCGFRDNNAALEACGVTVFGLSTQDTAYQREMSSRLRLPFEVLSDERLELTTAMALPTFDMEGMVLLKRVTLVLSKGRVERVFYPVFPPERNAETVLRWLEALEPPAPA
ncbi:MAG: peroxiredoxin [Minicystis sp.]